jgi:hypothetical protein
VKRLKSVAWTRDILHGYTKTCPKNNSRLVGNRRKECGLTVYQQSGISNYNKQQIKHTVRLASPTSQGMDYLFSSCYVRNYCSMFQTPDISFKNCIEVVCLVVHVDGVRLCLWTAATNGPTVHLPGDIWSCRVTVEWYRLGRTLDSSTRAVWQFCKQSSTGCFRRNSKYFGRL